MGLILFVSRSAYGGGFGLARGIRLNNEKYNERKNLGLTLSIYGTSHPISITSSKTLVVQSKTKVNSKTKSISIYGSNNTRFIPQTHVTRPGTLIVKDSPSYTGSVKSILEKLL